MYPWEKAPLNRWSIVGMNHYMVNDVKCLYVAMKKGSKCIVAQGDNDDMVFVSLEIQAKKHERKRNANK